MFYQSRKQKPNKFKGFILSLLIAGVLVAAGVRPTIIAQTADELAQQKAEKQKKLADIENQIKQYNSEISQTQKQANTLANQIKTLNLEIAVTQSEIEATGNKIDATNLEIAEVTEKIIQTEADIARQKDILKNLLVDINDLDLRSPLEIALENDNFDQFLDQVQYVTSIQQQSQDTLTKVKTLEADLQVRQDELK